MLGQFGLLVFFGVIQVMFCVGFLMLQVLQCMQFCVLIWKCLLLLLLVIILYMFVGQQCWVGLLQSGRFFLIGMFVLVSLRWIGWFFLWLVLERNIEDSLLKLSLLFGFGQLIFGVLLVFFRQVQFGLLLCRVMGILLLKMFWLMKLNVLLLIVLNLWMVVLKLWLWNSLLYNQLVLNVLMQLDSLLLFLWLVVRVLVIVLVVSMLDFIVVWLFLILVKFRVLRL